MIFKNCHYLIKNIIGFSKTVMFFLKKYKSTAVADWFVHWTCNSSSHSSVSVRLTFIPPSIHLRTVNSLRLSRFCNNSRARALFSYFSQWVRLQNVNRLVSIAATDVLSRLCKFGKFLKDCETAAAAARLQRKLSFRERSRWWISFVSSRLVSSFTILHFSFDLFIVRSDVRPIQNIRV